MGCSAEPCPRDYNDTTISQFDIERPVGEEIGPEGDAVIEVLGDHPKTRILLALLTDPHLDYNITDIARLADTDRSTVYRHLDDFIELVIVVRTRKSGNAPMYQINNESEAAEAFAQFEWEVIKAFGELETQHS